MYGGDSYLGITGSADLATSIAHIHIDPVPTPSPTRAELPGLIDPLAGTRSAFDQGFATFSRCYKQDAVKLFSQHLRQYPRHFECWMYRGISYEILGDQPAAVSDYSEAEKWGTPCENVVVRGLRMRVQGKEKEASEAFRLAKESYPGEAIAWHFYGIDRMGHDAKDEAQEAFERAIAAKYRRSCVSRYFLGQLLAAKGNHNEAVQLYRDSLKENPNTTICHIALGDSLFQTGTQAEAKERYETAIQLNPTQVAANLGLARILIREDNSDAAVQHVMKWADPSTVLSMSSGSMDGGDKSAGEAASGGGGGSSGGTRAGGGGGSGGGAGSGSPGGGDSSSGSGGTRKKKGGTDSGRRELHTSATAKKPWKITEDQTLNVAEHDRVGNLFQWKKNKKFWFAVDTARHAGARYKIFEEKGNKLVFCCSADEYGQFMKNKHESNARTEKQRLTILKKDLRYKSHPGKKDE